MERLGIALGAGLSPAETVECVRLAEEAGYESAWIIEGHGGDQFSLLTACALATTRVRLGTAISSVFVRTAPTIAMAAACLDHFSNGRFVLGLGSSHKVQVEVEHGVHYADPVTRVRETVEVVRALLRDGAVSFHGKTITIEHFDLWFKPAHTSVPIYLSALFPQMLALCGEVAQGLLMVFATPGSIRTAVEHLCVGAARAGRDVKELEIASLLPASIAEDRKVAYDRVRPVLAFYVGYFPRYQRVAREAGFGAAVDAIAEASKRSDTARTHAAIPDEMVARLTASGTPADLRARIAEYRRSGLALPILMPVASGPDAMAAVAETLRAGAG
ncbi:MAG TPA: LLM class flavin-dependent oxidoreductase [Candidatus Binataceae bacterium]|nr:LLM class flavin-dependent oxidoreductase [Candidatus Binataceae bacterium]